ncbi:diguanylate cyclase [Paucibacter soli]|uniref:diguanylate cyclase n=1 Tax=Paucibacter soli TaxID=3133433 RepID=UPI0030A2623A
MSSTAKVGMATADAMIAAGQHARAVALLEDLLAELAPEHPRLRGQLLNRLASSYPCLGQSQQGLRAAHEAVQLFKRLPSGLAGLSTAHGALAFCYAMLRMGQEALQAGLRALHSAREAGNAELEAWALNRIGLAYEALGDLQQAQTSTTQSLEIAQRQELAEPHFAAINNLCGFASLAEHEALLERQDARAQGHALRALQLTEQACQLARASGNAHWLAAALANRVDALLSATELEQAAALIDEYLPLAQAQQFAWLVLQAQLQRARLLQLGDQAGRAIAILRSLLAADLDRLPPKLKRRAVHMLVGLHKQRGEYYEALQSLEQLAELDRRWAQDKLALHSKALLIREEVALAQARAELASRDAERERERAERLLHEHEALSSQAAELGRIAVEDVLTGLYNRRHADQVLPLLSQRALSQGQPLSVAMLDLDHFKQINDGYGHAMGDQVLRAVAQHLRTSVRSADLMARIGGEEFVVALLGAPLAKAREICERMRGAIAAHDWEALAPELKVSVSIGLACAQTADEHGQLLERADQALYAAKHAGRNQVRVSLADAGPAGREVPTAA